VFSLAAIVHFGYFRHHARFQAFKSYDTLHIVFFCTLFDCRLPSLWVTSAVTSSPDF